MDVKQQMMKKIVLAGLVMFFALGADAQAFKKGESVEINRDLSDDGSESWARANVIDVDIEAKRYTVRTNDKKLYQVPFSKENNWIRKSAQSISASIKETSPVIFAPSVEMLKQKIKENFDTDFSEYDSVIITYDNIEALPRYKSTDDDIAKPGTEVYPFNVDFTVRLVNNNEDGTQRKLNWQFKRKYLLYQNNRGKSAISIAEKEEQLVSHI